MRHPVRKKSNFLSSAFFAVGIHAALFGLMFLNLQWQHQKPAQIAEVTLWDAIPQTKPAPKPVKPPVVKPKPVPEPEPAPEPKPEPKPDPEPKPKVEEKPEPAKPSAADIALAKKKKAEQVKRKKAAEAKKKKETEKKRKAAAARKKKEKLKKLKQEMLAEEQSKKDEALKRLQADALAQEQVERDSKAQAAQAAVNASIVDQYKLKIANKIKGYTNRSSCKDRIPTFKIGLLPSGQLKGAPRITKSSGIPACDDAVTRAIIAAEPLPLPDEHSLRAKFRNIELTFKPFGE